MALDEAPSGGKLIDAGDASGNLTSKIMNLSNVHIVSLHLVSPSAARGGTITIEVSNDRTNWATVTLANGDTSITVTAASALNEMVDLYGIGARWLRVVFTDSASGAGSLTVIALAKKA